MQHNTEILNMFSRAQKASGFAEAVVELGKHANNEIVWEAHTRIIDALRDFGCRANYRDAYPTIAELDAERQQIRSALSGAATILDEVLEAESND